MYNVTIASSYTNWRDDFQEILFLLYCSLN